MAVSSKPTYGPPTNWRALQVGSLISVKDAHKGVI
jgi:hypothetical protein